MNILLIGDYPASAKARIRACFPSAWRLDIATADTAENALATANVVIPEHVVVDADFLAGAPQLGLVQTGAGYDNVDLEACSAHGVKVCNAAGINAVAVAEHVMAMLLCQYKNLCALSAAMRNGEKVEYAGRELRGSTIGLIGLGHVGREVARLANAFGLRVLGWSHRPIPVPAVTPVDLATLYAESDIVSPHVPLTAETRGMIDANALSKMKPDALLINTARGGLVDEEALVQALVQGKLGGACLDVTAQEPLAADSPLRSLPNMMLTPHTAGYPDGEKFHARRYAFFAENIRRFETGEPLRCLLTSSET